MTSKCLISHIALATLSIFLTLFPFPAFSMSCIEGLMKVGGHVTDSKTPALIKTIPPWDSLPQVYSFDLPENFASAIRTSKVAQHLKRNFKNGQGFTFYIHRYMEISKEGMFKGETIQAQFLARVLHIIFPEAAIIGDDALPSLDQWLVLGKPNTFILRIRDSAETGSTPQENESAIIEMSTLKQANPGRKIPDRGIIRQLMGLPPTSNIISFYSGGYGEPMAYLPLLSRFFANASVDGVIFTHTQLDKMKIVNLREFAQQNNIPVFISSEIQNVDSSKKFLIINESVGKMAYVHGASNMTFVFAEGNIFESLNAGIPTAFSKSPTSKYDSATWQAMVDSASLSPIAYPIEDINRYFNSLTIKLGFAEATPIEIWRLRGLKGHSPLEILISEISRALSVSAQKGEKGPYYKHPTEFGI